MTTSGNLRKMAVELVADTAQYSMRLVKDGEEQRLDMNALVGEKIHLSYNGDIHCVACGRKTKKSFQQGHCFPCMRALPECDTCIVRPETCHFDAGTCRDESWAKNYCFQPHYVYLANSSGVKVGITRGSQIPTRWIDQGAIQALAIFKVQTRLQSGLLEMALKQHVSDRTDWRKMLKGDVSNVDLFAKRDELFDLCASEIASLQARYSAEDIVALTDESLIDINYPVQTYPTKVKSFNFDKTAEVSGILQGIKGQYLIFDTGVINIRKFGGYFVTLT